MEGRAKLASLPEWRINQSQMLASLRLALFIVFSLTVLRPPGAVVVVLAPPVIVIASPTLEWRPANVSASKPPTYTAKLQLIYSGGEDVRRTRLINTISSHLKEHRLPTQGEAIEAAVDKWLGVSEQAGRSRIAIAVHSNYESWKVRTSGALKQRRSGVYIEPGATTESIKNRVGEILVSRGKKLQSRSSKGDDDYHPPPSSSASSASSSTSSPPTQLRDYYYAIKPPIVVSQVNRAEYTATAHVVRMPLYTIYVNGKKKDELHLVENSEKAAANAATNWLQKAYRHVGSPRPGWRYAVYDPPVVNMTERRVDAHMVMVKLKSSTDSRQNEK